MHIVYPALYISTVFLPSLWSLPLVRLGHFSPVFPPISNSAFTQTATTWRWAIHHLASHCLTTCFSILALPCLRGSSFDLTVNSKQFTLTTTYSLPSASGQVLPLQHSSTSLWPLMYPPPPHYPSDLPCLQWFLLSSRGPRLYWSSFNKVIPLGTHPTSTCLD